MLIGAAANPLAENPEVQVDYLEQKIDAGADFIQTQAIYDINGLEKWMDIVRARGIETRSHILCGLIPVKSSKTAAYLNEKVFGIEIPKDILDRFEEPVNAKEVGIEVSLELINGLKRLNGISGVHIMPVGWEDAAPIIVEKAGLIPRPFA
jgi:methylenetetrahydrofolate reductase (NADPH)